MEVSLTFEEERSTLSIAFQTRFYDDEFLAVLSVVKLPKVHVPLMLYSTNPCTFN